MLDLKSSKKSHKFMRYALRRLKNKNQLKSSVLKELSQWIDDITVHDLRVLALVKMTEGHKQHGDLKKVDEIDREIVFERLDLLIWGLMREYQMRKKGKLNG